MEDTLKELIDIISSETREYVCEDNAADLLIRLLAEKDSDLDDLKEDMSAIVSGEIESGDDLYEKYVRPNFFISYAYLCALMRESEIYDEENEGGEGNPYVDYIAELLDVPLSEYLSSYSGNIKKSANRLKEVTDLVNASSNDN